MSKSQKEALAAYFKGEIGIATAAQAFEETHQVIRSISSGILRHLVGKGEIDIDDVLKQY